jgi:hypothetical protein
VSSAGRAAFTKLAGWTKKKGTWVKVVPKAMRRAMTDATSGVLDIGTVELAREPDAEAIALIAAEICVQSAPGRGQRQTRLGQADQKSGERSPHSDQQD